MDYSTAVSEGYTMRITYMFRDQPCTIIDREIVH